MPRGGKRVGAGRKPGSLSKKTIAGLELRQKLKEMGQSPLEVLKANMLADQAVAERLSEAIAKLDLDKLDTERAKALRGLLVEAAVAKTAANSAANMLAPYEAPKRAAQDERVSIELPKMDTAADLPIVQDAILNAVTGGQISPEEGVRISAIVEAKRKALETLDQERRLAALEAKAGVK
jgi:hypothetical protein